MKFKVGDKVRVINEDSALFGTEGAIIEVDKGRLNPYVIDVMTMPYKAKDLELIEESKPIKSNRLEELTTAINILGSLGVELDVKIYAEINGKKISL